jgi:hypothetical protein
LVKSTVTVRMLPLTDISTFFMNDLRVSEHIGGRLAGLCRSRHWS